MPTISVIVPVYRVEPYLHRCVDSILGQTYEDFELILVDDGSPDNCGAMCDEYAQKDSRVHVIHQKNGGLSAARNAGIDWVFANSDSQWLTFVDSDDWVHKDMLRTLINSAHQYNVPISMCGFVATDKVLTDPVFSNIETDFCTAEHAYVTYYSHCMHAWGKIIQRPLMENLRFPVGKLHEDAYVTHILNFDAKQVAVCDVPLYYYFSNPDSITRVKWSEKRLHEIEAREIRKEYLAVNGYQKAYCSEVEEYCRVLFAQMQDLRILSKEDSSYKKYQKNLRPKMMAAFREARKYGKYPYSPQTVWMYELAYPVKPIWVLRNLLVRQ